MAAAYDRTAEFLGVAEAIRSQMCAQIVPPDGSVPPDRPPPMRPPVRIAARSTVYTHSHTLSNTIRAVTAATLNLTRLAQRKALFDDPGPEINRLTMEVKTALAALDTSLREFVSAAHTYARTHTNTLGRGGGKEGTGALAHWTGVAEVLQGHVLEVTRAFQRALRLRSAALAEQSERRRELSRSTWAPLVDMRNPLFAQGAAAAGAVDAGAASAGAATVTHAVGVSAGPPSGVAPFARAGAAPHVGTPSSSTVITSPFALNAGGAAAGAADSGLRRRNVPGQHEPLLGHSNVRLFSRAAAAPPGGSSPQPHENGAADARAAYAGRVPLAASSYTTQQLAQYRDAASRADEMKQVESTIVELGHMFTRMASLVAEQGETISRIDTDMDQTLDNVNAGVDSLQQFYKTTMANRSFILKLFGVVILVIVLVAIFRR